MRAFLFLLLVCLMPANARGETFAERSAALGAHAQVLLPAGAGPFPVVLQFHGCGGVKEHQARYAEAARDAGWAAVIVDSYAHRGISRLAAYASVCTGARLWGRERAGDVYAAIAWARAQAWADGDRLALAGWSHGGWSVLDALALSPAAAARATRLSDLPAAPLAGVRGVFLVYPYCGYGCVAARQDWRIHPLSRGIVAGRDRVVGHERPLRVLRRLGVETEVFEGATHAFDEAGANDLRVRHDPALTARAMALYQSLLRDAAR